MAVMDRVREIAARIAHCEQEGASPSEVEELRARVAELEREVSSTRAANAYLRSVNADLRTQLRELQGRIGTIRTLPHSWPGHG